jgi:hypothetical protein
MIQVSRHQFSLKTLFAFVTAVGIALALLKLGRLELALGLAFPFAVGLAVGHAISYPHSVWMAAIGGPFAVSFSINAVLGFVYGYLPIPAIPVAGFWFGVFLLLTGVPPLAAITGVWASRKLSQPAIPLTLDSNQCPP